MQRTCGHCGFVNAQHPGSAVCPKCLRAYRSHPSTAATAGTIGAAVAAGTRRIGRALAFAVLGVLAFGAVVAWMGEKTSESAARNSAAAAKAAQAQQDNLQRAIAEGRVLIGMRAEQVRAAWGDPTSINTTTLSSGTQEQWVYRWSNTRQQFVYLSNGAVRSIQTLGN